MAPALLAGPDRRRVWAGLRALCFRDWHSYEGLPIVVLKCNPPWSPVEARDTPGLTRCPHDGNTATHYSTRTILD